jgi:hypothetical protein
LNIGYRARLKSFGEGAGNRLEIKVPQKTAIETIELPLPGESTSMGFVNSSRNY